MRQITLYVLAAYFVLTSAYLFFFPQIFYDSTPGLAEMGPFNFHFIRDVSFAFLVGGATLAYGTKIGRRDVLVIGSAWPFLHSIFHLTIWMHRGFPFDVIWASDFAGVVVPGFLAMGLAMTSKPPVTAAP